MNEPVTVTISHRLGKAEAVRRLQEGLARSGGRLGPVIAIEDAVWDGDRVRFRLNALGQSAQTTIDVLEDAMRIEVALPLLLAKAAKHLLPLLRKEATNLIEKK